MGMWLPYPTEVAFFTANFAKTRNVLAEKLEDPEIAVRQRAAYVVEGIGPKARPLKDSLLRALHREKESIGRIYLCSALRAVGDGGKDVLAALRAVVSQKSKDHDALNERLYASAALFVLSDDSAERTACEQYVCRWLRPPSANLSTGELQDYWDMRWSAVIAVQHMRGAKRAIPLLKAMLAEPSRQPWVNLHVPRALAALRE